MSPSKAGFVKSHRCDGLDSESDDSSKAADLVKKLMKKPLKAQLAETKKENDVKDKMNTSYGKNKKLMLRNREIEEQQKAKDLSLSEFKDRLTLSKAERKNNN